MDAAIAREGGTTCKRSKEEEVYEFPGRREEIGSVRRRRRSATGAFNEEHMMKRRAMVIYSRGLIQSASRAACAAADSDFMLASTRCLLLHMMNLAF